MLLIHDLNINYDRTNTDKYISSTRFQDFHFSGANAKSSWSVWKSHDFHQLHRFLRKPHNTIKSLIRHPKCDHANSEFSVKRWSLQIEWKGNQAFAFAWSNLWLYHVRTLPSGFRSSCSAFPNNGNVSGPGTRRKTSIFLQNFQ